MVILTLPSDHRILFGRLIKCIIIFAKLFVFAKFLCVPHLDCLELVTFVHDQDLVSMIQGFFNFCGLWRSLEFKRLNAFQISSGVIVGDTFGQGNHFVSLTIFLTFQSILIEINILSAYLLSPWTKLQFVEDIFVNFA